MNYLVKYGLVGIVSTFLHILMATFLIYIYSMNIVYANWFAFISAFSFSYIGNTKFVFKQKVHKQNFKKFLSVSFITFFIITIISYFGKMYQVNSYITIFIIAIVIPTTTFILHKTWTFKDSI